jgi:hypothetical protein
MSHYVHHVPGRLRVKSPELKRNERNAATLQQALGSARGVTAAEVNTLTGSVVISYDRHTTSPHHIWDTLKQHGLIDAQLALEHAGDAVTHAVGKAAQSVGKFAAGFVLEKVLERSAVALIGAVL